MFGVWCLVCICVEGGEELATNGRYERKGAVVSVLVFSILISSRSNRTAPLNY